MRHVGAGRAVGAVIVIGAAALCLSACVSSGDASGTSSPESTPAPTTSVAPTPTPSATTTPTRAPSSTAGPSSTTPAPSTSPVSSAPAAPAFTTTCPKLSVLVIPGGAIRGAEIAALQYTNDGTAACTITGVPSAVLLRDGEPIGTPSYAGRGAVRPFTLQPGDVGESLLRDFSTCNAPLSDSIRITTPVRGGGSAPTVVRPAKLRACEIQLAPVGRPA